MVGDIEEMFARALLRQARQQQPSNPKVLPRTLTFRDQRIGRLLNPVVWEGVISLHAEDQPVAGCIQKPSVNALFGLSEDHTQGRYLSHVPQTGELLESDLRPVRQSLQFPQHEIHHIVGVALGANSVQVKGPARAP